MLIANFFKNFLRITFGSQDFKVLKIGSNSDFAELPIPAILYYYYNTYIIIFMHCYTRIVRYNIVLY